MRGTGRKDFRDEEIFHQALPKDTDFHIEEVRV
jgi:hypothetical protein